MKAQEAAVGWTEILWRNIPAGTEHNHWQACQDSWPPDL